MTTPKKKLVRPRKSPAYTRENAANKVAIAATAKKPRPLSTAIEPSAPVLVTRDVWRAQARNDFVMDPEKRTITWHHSRPDRPYENTWTLGTFAKFATDEHWMELREKFWREVEERVWHLQKEKVVAQKLMQLEKLTNVYEYAIEWLGPVIDRKTGEIKRYPDDHETFGGLPRFALEMPSIEKYMVAMMKFQQQLMLLRGEATSRTENLAAGTDGSISSTDPVGASQSFTKDELRAIARMMVRRRQPELIDQPEIDIASDGRPDVRDADDENTR